MKLSSVMTIRKLRCVRQCLIFIDVALCTVCKRNMYTVAAPYYKTNTTYKYFYPKGNLLCLYLRNFDSFEMFLNNLNENNK